jgi:hypothetical protein
MKTIFAASALALAFVGSGAVFTTTMALWAEGVAITPREVLQRFFGGPPV